MRGRRSGALVAAVIALLALVAFRPADAIPAFQRQTGLPCRNCHTLAPVLNRFGQRFLDNGYRLTREWAGRSQTKAVTSEAPDLGARDRLPSWLPVSLRLRLNGLAEQPEETLEFRVASFSLEIGFPFAQRASFWTDFFLRTGRENARLGDVIVGYYGLLRDRVDLQVGQLSPPLLIESQRRLLIDLPDVYARGSLVNGWFLAGAASGREPWGGGDRSSRVFTSSRRTPTPTWMRVGLTGREPSSGRSIRFLSCSFTAISAT